MATIESRPGAATHEVLNQAPPLESHNAFDSDTVLVEALRREGGDWAEERARELGAICGRPATLRLGAEANENPPKLRTHDRYGNRVDEVAFHPPGTSCSGSASPRACTRCPGASRSRVRT